MTDKGRKVSKGRKLMQNVFYSIRKQEDEPLTQESWKNPWDFIINNVGCVVGNISFVMFPQMCYDHGGAVFIIMYFIVTLLIALPMFFVEVIIGTYVSRNPVFIYRNISPISSGIGYAIMYVSFLDYIPESIFMTWSIYYFFTSMTPTLPWATCGNKWNRPGCSTDEYQSECNSQFPNQNPVFYDGKCHIWKEFCEGLGLVVHNSTTCQPQNIVDCSDNCLSFKDLVEINTPAADYFLFGVSQTNLEWNGIGKFDLGIVLCYSTTWMVIFLAKRGGINTSVPVTRFTATIPLMILVFSAIQGSFLPGGIEGLMLLKPDFTTLYNPKVYEIAVAGDIPGEIGKCLRNKIEKTETRNPGLMFLRDVNKVLQGESEKQLNAYSAWFDAAALSLSSQGVAGGILTTLAAFHNSEATRRRCRVFAIGTNIIANILFAVVVYSFAGARGHHIHVHPNEIFRKTENIIYISYTDVLRFVRVPHLYGAIFFASLSAIGMDVQFTKSDFLVKAICELYPPLGKMEYIVRFVLCCCMWLFGLVFIAEGGYFLLTLFAELVPTGLFIITIFEIATLVWLYGYPESYHTKFFDLLSGVRHQIGFAIYKNLVVYGLPIAMPSLLISSLVLYQPIQRYGYVFPVGFQIARIILFLVPICIVTGVATFSIIQAKRRNQARNKIFALFKKY